MRSDKLGLILVIASSMVISMLGAGVAESLAPPSLSPHGQDLTVVFSLVPAMGSDIGESFSIPETAILLSGMLA